MKKVKIMATGVAFSLFGALPLPAMATDLSYNFAEFAYTFRSESANLDGNGFLLHGSLEVAPNILVLGRLEKLSFDESVDYTEMWIGAGYLRRMDPRFDLNASFMIGRQKADGPTIVDRSGSGFRLSGGIRGIVMPRAEAFANLIHVNTDGSDTYVEIGGRYNITKQISLGGTIDLGGELDRVRLAIRYNFL